MDQSRQADLKRIDERLATKRYHRRQEHKIVGRDDKGRAIVETTVIETHNPKTEKWAREQAGKARANIIAQSRDKQLTRLREQLIRATRAGDEKEMLNIEGKIRKYRREEFEDYS